MKRHVAAAARRTRRTADAQGLGNDDDLHSLVVPSMLPAMFFRSELLICLMVSILKLLLFPCLSLSLAIMRALFFLFSPKKCRVCVS